MTAMSDQHTSELAQTGVLTSPISRLLHQSHGFEFHQAVRLIECWLMREARGAQHKLRFSNSLSLSFPASEIAALKVVADDDVGALAPSYGGVPDPSTWQCIDITPAFMSLLGASGTLPLAYSEQLSAREVQHRDRTARAFLDIFQHRAVALFHAAWHKHRLPLYAEIVDHDRSLSLVLSLAGIGSSAVRDKLQARQGGVSDHGLAYYAGFLQRRCANANQLQRVLSDYFAVPVRIDQFVGRWCVLEPGSVSLVGASNATLGCDAVLGKRVWQRDLRLAVVIGPLSAPQQQRFLPGQPGALALKQLLTLVSGVSLEYEVRLRLLAEAVTPARLGSDATALGSRLGWNSFLLSQPGHAEREEHVYELHAIAA